MRLSRWCSVASRLAVAMAIALGAPHDAAFAQQPTQPITPIPAGLPVIRAHARTADIRENGTVRKGYWQIEPSMRPDVYVVRQSTTPRTVTLLTDRDSVFVSLQPGETRDVVVLLDSGDSAWTRFTTVDPVAERATRRNAAATVDTIPFTVSRDGKLMIRGTVNGSDTLDLMFDTGATGVVLSSRAEKKGVKVAGTTTQQNAAFGGTITIRRSDHNTMRIGGITWPDVPVLLIGEADADGIVGYPVFDGRRVEIDMTHSRLLVHATDSTIGRGWVRVPTRVEDGLFQIQAALTSARTEPADTGWFIFDTGSSGTLFLLPTFPASSRIEERSRFLGERVSRGVGPAQVRSSYVLLRALTVSGSTLREVPIDIMNASPYGAPRDGVLGISVLRRFDVLLDLGAQQVWLRPTATVAAPFEVESGSIGSLGVLGAAVMISLVVVLLMRRRLRQS